MSILAIGGFVMKAYDYNGTIIPLGDSVHQVAYVECSCGCLASRVTSDSNKYKCSWCKRGPRTNRTGIPNRNTNIR
ncbi:TPA: excinuclease ABC subunit C [Enterococcus faecalis]|uniref:hypothetical protein n=1 Tax=Enterococcus faecalis TaxID=1351 RepID=UPI000666BB53|nr:hypothetical protein [Enterococcus faecalis]MDK8223886.1 excinuclease ABC subunit C [Enterococcus faecalis]MDK8247871.1 excinuclease ABC subunit C [Enterococcus faecalis]MDV2524073.1 excinuclease ABC subunit C [Enterococcus faecalis]MDV2598670.1 excinuclease ABC subunit C [Enterococcus faecalis]